MRTKCSALLAIALLGAGQLSPQTDDPAKWNLRDASQFHSDLQGVVGTRGLQLEYLGPLARQIKAGQRIVDENDIMMWHVYGYYDRNNGELRPVYAITPDLLAQVEKGHVERRLVIKLRLTDPTAPSDLAFEWRKRKIAIKFDAVPYNLAPDQVVVGLKATPAGLLKEMNEYGLDTEPQE